MEKNCSTDQELAGWGWGVEQKWKYSSAQLGPELGNNFDLILFSDLMLI